jgi:phosphoglucomutase
MSGLLIAEYQIEQRLKKGLLTENIKDTALITTIVSSDMAKAIANGYGLTVMEVLTGFKYIGEQIKLFEQATKENDGKFDAEKGAYKFLFGFEESYGCLIGTHARDKDAVVAVLALCEAAAYYKTKGLTLCDQMENIYKKYGYYKETIHTAVMKGADGAAKITAVIEKLRNNPARQVGEFNTIAVRDYKTGKIENFVTGEKSLTGLPESNVLYYEFDGAWCCVRPSGTEPKIKFYFGVKANTEKESQEKLEKIRLGFLELTE